MILKKYTKHDPSAITVIVLSIIVLLFLAIQCFSAPVSAPGPNAAILSIDKPTLFVFRMENCHWCNALKQELIASPKLLTEIKKNVNIRIVDIPKSAPTVLLPDGRVRPLMEQKYYPQKMTNGLGLLAHARAEKRKYDVARRSQAKESGLSSRRSHRTLNRGDLHSGNRVTNNVSSHLRGRTEQQSGTGGSPGKIGTSSNSRLPTESQ